MPFTCGGEVGAAVITEPSEAFAEPSTAFFVSGDGKACVSLCLFSDIFEALPPEVSSEAAFVSDDASVEYSLVMPGAVIKKGAKVKYSIIAENTVIGENAEIGTEPAQTDTNDWGITVIGDNLTVGKKAVVGAKKMITENVGEEEKI